MGQEQATLGGRMEELVGDIVDIVETPPPDTSWISNDDGPFYVGFTYVPATSIIARRMERAVYLSTGDFFLRVE